MAEDIIIGTAGWSIGRQLADRFTASGSALERYASRLRGVEINSSFYRRHKPATWQRWHDAVPPGFRFAVKLPKVITHEQRLVDVEAPVHEFFTDIAPLGSKLGPILVQLPPSLPFERARDAAFFGMLRRHTAVPIVVEPRHVSWAGAEADAVLDALEITRVYADPQLPALRSAVDLTKSVYMRLHGAPKVYYSAYAQSQLAHIAEVLLQAQQAWCIFDNTAPGAALNDALRLLNMLDRSKATELIGRA